MLFPAGPDASFRFDRDFANSMIFSAVFAVVISIVMQLDRLLGRGVLASFVIGRYHKPREEERIFLFLDLVGSTALAERPSGSRRSAASWAGFSANARIPPASAFLVVSCPAVKVIRK